MPPPDQSRPRPFLTCREIIDFLMEYIDRTLPDEQRREFERHLAVCPSCVNYLESYQSAVRLGKAAMVDPEQPAEQLVPEALIRAVRKARTGNS